MENRELRACECGGKCEVLSIRVPSDDNCLYYHNLYYVECTECGKISEDYSQTECGAIKEWNREQTMELNREQQIVRTYECCHSILLGCGDCPFIKNDEECADVNMNIVAILKSQEEKIKQLTQAHEMLSESYDHLEKTKDELLAERSRLTEENEKIGIENFDLICELSRIKENTVREMQERILARKMSYGNVTFRVVPIDDINQIAKEMLEGEK